MNARLGLAALVFAAALTLTREGVAADLVLDDPPVAVRDDKNVDFRAELGEVIAEWTAGPWGPFYRTAAYNERLYFWSPSETLVSIAQALPYVEQADRDKAVAALDAFIAKHDPLTKPNVMSDNYGPVSKLGDAAQAGRWRAYAPPPAGADITFNFYPYPTVSGFALYAVWSYAFYADKKAWVDAHWSEVTALYNQVKGTPDGVELWAKTGAMIGAARLAKMHGDAAMQAEAAGFAAQGLAKAAQFATHAAAYDGHERFQIFALPLVGYAKGTKDPKVSRALAREVLRAIGASATGRAEASAYVGAYEHVNDYTFGPSQVLKTTLVDWSATEHGGWAASEGGSLAPENPWGLFMVHAYALGTNQDTLRPLLDVGHCRADLMYIDRLVAAIEATPGAAAPPPPDLKPGALPTPGEGPRGGDNPAASSSGDGGSGCDCQLTRPQVRGGLALGAFGLATMLLFRRRGRAQ